jgi:hypothetical protein
MWEPDIVERDLADALRSAMSDRYADVGDAEMQDALDAVLETMTPAEAFDFGAALNRIAKGASQVVSDPTFQAVTRTALPLVGQAVGTIYGGPAGAAIGGGLGNLAAGAIGGLAQPPPPPAPAARPATAVTAPPAAGGSAAAAQALILTQQPDVLRSLLATALGQQGRTAVSGIPTARVLSELSEIFGEAAADADQLGYLSESTEAEQVESGPPGSLYADLMSADNAELAEAAEWEEMRS